MTRGGFCLSLQGVALDCAATCESVTERIRFGLWSLNRAWSHIDTCIDFTCRFCGSLQQVFVQTTNCLEKAWAIVNWWTEIWIFKRLISNTCKHAGEKHIKVHHLWNSCIHGSFCVDLTGTTAFHSDRIRLTYLVISSRVFSFQKNEQFHTNSTIFADSHQVLQIFWYFHQILLDVVFFKRKFPQNFPIDPQSKAPGIASWQCHPTWWHTLNLRPEFECSSRVKNNLAYVWVDLWRCYYVDVWSKLLSKQIQLNGFQHQFTCHRAPQPILPRDTAIGGHSVPQTGKMEMHQEVVRRSFGKVERDERSIFCG